MNVLPSKYRAILGAVVVICVASVSTAKSCGDFRKPETHFDGVNEYGFVSYWDQLGEIKLSDGTVLPLIIGFRSDWETLTPSPHLGSGWLFGLLDSYFVQRSENAFDMISIDGYTVPFGRDPKAPSILNGAQGWKAEIKGDVVTVWAECGWKLQFTKGKISGITTPKNSVVQIRRDQTGLVNDIVEGTNILLKLHRDSATNLTVSLRDDKIIRLRLTEKPFIESVNGVNVIGARNLAIGNVVKPDLSAISFDYSLSETLEPRMTVVNEGNLPRLFTWNPSTRIISSDGKWKYDITTSNTPGYNAKIARTNNAGQQELWHYDQLKGSEAISHASGSQETRFFFSTGLLAGKLRKKVVKESDSEITISPSYSEKGDLLRTTTYRKLSIQREHSLVEKVIVSITDSDSNPQLIFAQ